MKSQSTLEEIAEAVVNGGVEVAIGTERGSTIYRRYAGYVHGPQALARILKHFGYAAQCRKHDPLVRHLMSQITLASIRKAHARAIHRAKESV